MITGPHLGEEEKKKNGEVKNFALNTKRTQAHILFTAINWPNLTLFSHSGACEMVLIYMSAKQTNKQTNTEASLCPGVKTKKKEEALPLRINES